MIVRRKDRAVVSPLLRLDLRTRLLRAVLRSWPFSRGRWRLESLVEPLMKIPDSGTVEFAYGTFVDTPLAAWPNGYREVFLYGYMEREELKVWKRLLRPGDAVVDGGANYGYWSLVAASLTGPAGKVFAFEASPLTAARLESNVNASQCRNIRIYASALSCDDGTAEINVADQNAIAAHSSLHAHKSWKWTKTVPVRLTRLDDIATKEGWPALRLVKLDIEGAELSALKGMQRTLLKDKPFLTVEWNVSAASGFGYHPREMVAYLQDQGFALVRPTRVGFLPAEPPAEDDVSMLWFVPAQGQSRP